MPRFVKNSQDGRLRVVVELTEDFLAIDTYSKSSRGRWQGLDAVTLSPEFVAWLHGITRDPGEPGFRPAAQREPTLRVGPRSKR